MVTGDLRLPGPRLGAFGPPLRAHPVAAAPGAAGRALRVCVGGLLGVALLAVPVGALVFASAEVGPHLAGVAAQVVPGDARPCPSGSTPGWVSGLRLRR